MTSCLNCLLLVSQFLSSMQHFVSKLLILIFIIFVIDFILQINSCILKVGHILIIFNKMLNFSICIILVSVRTPFIHLKNTSCINAYMYGI